MEVNIMTTANIYYEIFEKALEYILLGYDPLFLISWKFPFHILYSPSMGNYLNGLLCVTRTYRLCGIFKIAFVFLKQLLRPPNGNKYCYFRKQNPSKPKPECTSI